MWRQTLTRLQIQLHALHNPSWKVTKNKLDKKPLLISVQFIWLSSKMSQFVVYGTPGLIKVLEYFEEILYYIQRFNLAFECRNWIPMSNSQGSMSPQTIHKMTCGTFLQTCLNLCRIWPLCRICEGLIWHLGAEIEFPR